MLSLGYLTLGNHRHLTFSRAQCLIKLTSVCYRIVDPTVDLVRVDWSPFKKSTFILPLLNDLEGWRHKLESIAAETEMNDTSWFLENPDVTFIADFPGQLVG